MEGHGPCEDELEQEGAPSLVWSRSSFEMLFVPPMEPQTVPSARSGWQAVTATVKDSPEGFHTADVLALLTMARHLDPSPG